MAVIRLLAAWVLGVAFLSAAGHAQAATDSLVDQPPALNLEEGGTPSAEPPAEEPAGHTIPKLTIVSLEILADLSSNGSKSLETFPICLAKPIERNGVTLVEAGASGMGEVVHAKKAGGSGAPGELVLAARYLDVDGRRMPLRSLRFAGTGENKIADVNTLNTVAAATVPAVALVGFFMKGGEFAVARGTIVTAKLAEDFQVATAPAVQSQPAGETNNQEVQLGKESEENANQ